MKSHPRHGSGSLPYWAMKYRALATADCQGLFLASLDDVEVVVKAFVGRAIRVWNDRSADDTKRAIFASVEALNLAAVFYGKDPGYRATEWNDPCQLGYAFGDRVGIQGDAVQAMCGFWVRLAGQVFDLLDQTKSGKLAEERADFECAVLIEEARYALVGLRLSSE